MSAWTAPYWQANTAYLAGAVVTPVTPNGTVWRCTVAGTSGGAEPTWPSGSPWSVTDGGVTWRRGTTFRQDVNTALGTTVLQAFATANPTLLRKVYTERPLSLSAGELPCAWIGSMDESITWPSTQSGIRQREMQGLTFYVADVAPEPEVYSDRTNFLVDALVDFISANLHPTPNSILEPQSVAEQDEDEGGVHFTVTAVGCRAYIAEGYP